MKALRIALFVFAGLLLVLLLAVVVLMIPAVQRSMAVRLASGPDQTLELEALRLRPGSAQVRGATLIRPDATYAVRELEATFSLGALIFGRELRVHEVTARGISLDLSRMEERPPEEERPDEPREPFEGILREVELPMPLYLGRVSAEGEIILSEAGAPGQVDFRLTGGGLAPGEEGTLQMWAERRQAGQPVDLRVEGVVRVAQGQGGRISRIAVEGEGTAPGAGDAPDQTVRISADLREVDGGEAYVARLFAVGEQEPIVAIEATYAEAAQAIAGRWNLDVGRGQLDAFLGGREAPEFLAAGAGEFRYGTVDGTIAVSGFANAQAQNLAFLAEELRGLGAFRVHLRFDLGLEEDEVHLRELIAEIHDRDERVLLEARNFREVRYDLRQERLVGAEEGVEVLQVSLRDLPVEWSNLFLGNTGEADALAVEGGSLTGQLRVVSRNDTLEFNLAEPLAIDRLSVRQGESWLIREVAVTVHASGQILGGGIVADLDRLEVTSGEGVLVLGRGRYNGAADRVGLGLEISLPALTAQPLLAEANVALQGNLVLNVEADLGDSPRTSIRGTLQDLVWPDMPELTTLGEFAVQLRGDLVEVERIDARVVDSAGRVLMTVANQQPFAYDSGSGRLVNAEAGVDLVSLSLDRLPLVLANPFLASPDGEALRVDGGILSGRLLVRAEGEGFVVGVSEPLRGEGIHLREGEEWLLRDLGFALRGSARMTGEEWTAEIAELRATGGGEEMLRLSATYDGGTERARGQLRAVLPVLLAQPALAHLNNTAAGLLHIEGEATMSGQRQIEATARVSDLRLRAEQESAPNLELRARVRETAPGEWEISLPMQVMGRQPSDLLLAGRIRIGDTTSRLRLDLSSTFLNLEDLLQVAAAFTVEEEAAPGATAAANNERDEEPFWSGVVGEVRLAVEELRLPGQHPMREMRGELTLEETELLLALAGGLLESPVELGGQLRFVTANARPYLLEGSLEAPRLSAGHFFQQIQPGRPPTVEGIFSLSAEVRGDGNNLEDLMDRARGQMNLQAGEGTLRLFHTENPLAGLGMAVGGLLGSLSPEVAAVMDVARNLSHIRYNQLTFQVERDENLNFLLRDLTMISPELQLRGVGEVRYRDGIAVLQQPMNLRFQLGARGNMERLLGTVRVLGDERDPDGFRRMRQDFTIAGTPANPDNSGFYRILANTAMQFLGPRNGREGEAAEAEAPPPTLQGVLEGLLRDRRR